MPLEKLDYASILNDLETKKAAIDATIASLRSAMAIGALGQAGDLSVPTSGSPISQIEPLELPSGALLGKSIPAAIKLYLSAVKKKQTIRTIASALRDGGVESTSPNFEGVITGALNRLKVAGEVLRFKDGWGLAELYPESLRARISLVSKPAKKKGKRSAKRAKPSVEIGPKPAPQVGVAPQRLVMDHVASLQGKRITTAEVASALQMRKQTVALILSKIAHSGDIAKNPDGSFTVGKAAEGAGMVN